MKHLTLLLAASMLAFGLSACSGKSDDKATIVETQDLPTIDMVATHAIDLDMSVAQLTFVPNSVAPWLGRIILLDDNGRLYSTDIEGREPKPVGSGKYIDIFGLAREAAPGVFLAINTDNHIEAFIESDNDGNFSPMIYSGEDIDAKLLCIAFAPAKSSAQILDASNFINTTELSLIDNVIQLETIDSFTFGAKIYDCSYDVLNYGVKTKYETVLRSKDEPRSGIGFVGTTGAQEYFLVSLNKLTGLSAINIVGEVDSLQIKIKNGLSVRGLEHVKYVASTQSNYGGGAYADGVLALVDKDENRIVFISLGYAERQLLKAVNQTENTTEETPQ